MPRVPSYLSAKETRIQFNVVSANEWSVAMVPRNWRYDQSVPTVIYCPSRTWGAYDMLLQFGATAELARRGYAVASSDLFDIPTKWGGGNGPGKWGNDTARSRGATLVTWCEDNLKTDPTRLVICAVSHGCAAACGLGIDLSAKVIAISLAIPTVDMEDIRANNRGSLQASIEAAYTNNATWQTARPTHNPTEIADDLAAIPIYDTYGTADTICLESTQDTFAAAHGDTTKVAMSGVGHVTASVDWTAMVDWIEALA